MIDAIGTRGISGRGLAVTQVEQVAQVTPAAAPASGTTAAAREPAPDIASLTGVARSLSASAPVNGDRVAQVRKAIAEGKFPLLPSTIADRLIAYKLEWRQNEKA